MNRLADAHGKFPGESHELLRHGGKLVYQVMGTPGRPWVVLTHGAALDHRMYTPQIEALRERYRVLVWDLPGHGRSRPMGSGFTLRRAADDLNAILEAAGAEQVVLVGQSMGGDVVQEFLFQHPELAAAAVLIGTLPLLRNRGLREQLQSRLAAWKMWITPLASWRAQVSQMITVHADVADHARKAMTILSRGDLVRVWSAIARGPHPETGWRLPCPCLLMIGEHDDLGGGLLRREAEPWARRDPRIQPVTVPGAAHLSNLDNPDFVNQELLQFLEACASGA